MSEWKECKLGAHIDINMRSVDKNYPYKQIEYLDTGSITKGMIDSYKCLLLIDAPSRAKRIVKDKDIVLSMVRPIQRHYGFLRNTKPNSVVSTGFVVLTCKKTLDPYFLYAYLTQDDITEYLDLVAEGSTSAYPAFTPDVVEQLSIKLPPLSEQRAIAGVLSSLDDKIDLLHRQNKTLEDMAMTLWRKMFVEEADPGWKKGKIGDLFILHRGYDLPAQDRVDGNFPIVSASGISGSHNSFKIKSPGIVTGRSGLIGKVYFIMHDFWPLNTTLYISEFRLGTPLYSYFFLKTVDLEGLNAGSAVPTLNRNDVHGINIDLPNKKIIHAFEDICCPLYKKINDNELQANNLSRLRNNLLPKLMSGEVRVQGI